MLWRVTAKVTSNLQPARAGLGHDGVVPHPYAFNKRLRNAQHTLRYSIAATDVGWEVREEHDSRVTRRVEYQDWHRVERARQSMTLKLADLRDKGWTDELES
jgi:hypothetical protein